MKWSNFTYRDGRAIADKLKLEQTGDGKHPVYWYILDGKRQLRITMTNQHGGSNSTSTGFIRNIMNHLKVNSREFEALIDCPLTPEQYEEIVRRALNV